MINLMLGDCLEQLKTLPDNSVDSIVTDPPYGLSFMGKKWDYDVPSVEIWEECLRVLKPGGHLLAFAGTRTQHRMAVRIEDAGFEIRDMIAWVYGCLSEDSEILTESGWMLYNQAKKEKVLTYDVEKDVYQWEKPTRWNEYCVKQDTAYRIRSDNTDQIVSRGHRCLVEREGKLVFVQADELSNVECMPYLQDDIFTLPKGGGEVLLKDVQWETEGLAQDIFSKRKREEVSVKGFEAGEESSMARWANVFQTEREICESGNQVCSVSSGNDEHGKKGRLRDGASVEGGVEDRQTTDKNGVCSPYQSRCDGQQAREFDAVCDQCGAQAVRARASYQTTLATVTAIEYSGMIWCPTVSTGAFVARRNGKVFITGNNGFPKSLDVSKAIDKAAGVEFDAVPASGVGFMNAEGVGGYNVTKNQLVRKGESTEAARQWQGWGTALKPALEPITVARKPLIGTVAQNVLAHGTGGINIDGCRVGESLTYTSGKPSMTKDNGWNDNNMTALPERTVSGRFPANFIHDGSDEVLALFPNTAPAKSSMRGIELTASDEKVYGKGASDFNTMRGFNDNGGSAARYFYCAKASKKDRDEGLEGFEAKRGTMMTEMLTGSGNVRDAHHKNNHPTVKPTDLMRYLCRLVTPPNGTVLDPFMGSGSTGKAAVLEGFSFIGCELSEEYLEIARARIASCQI